jgi:hypothetical protein
MEALIIAAAALMVMVLIDAGYWIAISLMRWSPVIIAGAAVGWLAVREGMAPAEALIMGVLASMVVRCLVRRAEGSHDWGE